MMHHPPGHLAPFPYDHFVAFFPKLACGEKNTPEFIEACGMRASMFLADMDSVWLRGERRIYAHCLLTAHILCLTNQNDKETNGGEGVGSVGPVISSSVGGVSVSLQSPNSSNDGPFEFWLNKTVYGQEFLGFIRTRGPTIAHIGSKNAVLPLR